jgi:hydroxyacylglutathione hydrolase
MFLKRFYEPKLAQASYMVGCSVTGEALVVDPNRDIDRYLEAAEAENLRVTHVTETHIHADFVSGARELAHCAGARLYLSDAGGEEWKYAYSTVDGATPIREGSAFRVGSVQVDVMHVPGHTPEHLTFLVTDTAQASEPMGALTGDFIFVGDVGRPDLLERAVRVKGAMEAGARQLFNSIQRFRDFPDYLQIWPGHGAGSACGKALGAVPQSTLGYEKRFNWAFSLSDENEFVRAVLAGQPEPPAYFAHMKRLNQFGPRLLGDARQPPHLSVAQLATLLADKAMVVDTRPASEFSLGGVPGTVNIPLNRSFTTWAGWMLPYDRDFYLIVGEDEGNALKYAVRDLAGIGLDRVAGYFDSRVIDGWRSSVGDLRKIPTLTLPELSAQIAIDGVVLLDVRSEEEWRAGHLPGSHNVPVGHLRQRLSEISNDRPVIAHCQSGSRAAIAASVLVAEGFRDVRLFPGGFSEWQRGGNPIETAAN